MVTSLQRVKVAALITLAGALSLLPVSVSAQTCPFDDGNSSLAVEGLVLTRYALGVTGAPLVANSGIAAVDAPTVEAAINCPSCGLNITGNPSMTVADATIITRKLAGITGSALTNGLALGSGTRNTPAAVQSFLLAGCGATNAFVKGGNTFGSAAVLGTNDAFDLRVVSGSNKVSLEIAGQNGLRVSNPLVSGYLNGANVTNGSAANQVGAGAAVTVAGGGYQGNNCPNTFTLAPDADCRNYVFGSASTVSGGIANSIQRLFGEVIGAVIGGGVGNQAYGDNSTVSGGRSNAATNSASVVSGGLNNKATGALSTIPGGQSNRADGIGSFAAGQSASALYEGTFAWGDSSSLTPITPTDVNQFVIRSAGGVHLNPATRLYFGQQTRQMINLWGTSATTPNEFGIGVQSGTTYFRSNSNFCWHKGGTHNDNFCTPGGTGTVQMALRDTAAATTAVGHLYAATFNTGSDRAVKTAIESINPRSVLRKVLAMPITSWAYKTDNTTRHIGPMAQDFHKAFGLGSSDKSIATVDADGVALAAIQGLHQMVKDKDAKIGALEQLNATMQKKLAAIEKRLGM